MSSEENTNVTETKPETVPSVPTAPQYPQGAGIFYVPVSASQAVSYPYLQPMPTQPQAPQVQRVYYQQTNQYVPLADTPAPPTTAPVSGGCERRWGFGCRWRRCGHGQQEAGGSCCMKLSNRPLGTFSEFVFNLFFGAFAPILAPLLVFGMETSQLARLGAIYGTADFFLLIGVTLLHVAAWMHRHAGLWVGAILCIIISIALFVSGCKRMRGYLYLYQQAVTKSKDQAMPVVSEVGKRCEFVVSFVISLFFPVIGTAIRMCCKKSLQSRFGALKGLAWFFLIFGAFGMNPPLFVLGLFLHQILKLHFSTAIISAEANATNVAINA